MMCSNDTRKIFKEICFEQKRARKARESFDLAKGRTNASFLFAMILVPWRSQRTNFWFFHHFFNFFLFSPFLVWTASRLSPHWKRDNYTRISATMAKRTKSARKAAKSVRPNRELLAREETLSHLFLPFFLRFSTCLYIYLMYKSRFPQFKGVSFPQFSHSRGD